jgi:hypothetical protein
MTTVVVTTAVPIGLRNQRVPFRWAENLNAALNRSVVTGPSDRGGLWQLGKGRWVEHSPLRLNQVEHANENPLF